MVVEVLLGAVAAAAVGFVVYKMLNDRNPLDLNNDGQVNKADAKVVVDKAKKNVRKAVNKTANKVADKTKTKAKSKAAK